MLQPLTHAPCPIPPKKPLLLNLLLQPDAHWLRAAAHGFWATTVGTDVTQNMTNSAAEANRRFVLMEVT